MGGNVRIDFAWWIPLCLPWNEGGPSRAPPPECLVQLLQAPCQLPWNSEIPSRLMHLAWTNGTFIAAGGTLGVLIPKHSLLQIWLTALRHRPLSAA